MRNLASLLLIPLCAALIGATAGAQTVNTIVGDVWDGNGGPFVTGQVYHIDGTSGTCCGRVPPGQTLTIQPGAIVKIDNALVVEGTLDARGATFTSWEDDTRGGDSNANGNATVPAPGDWHVIELRNDSIIEDCEILYGGGASPGAAVWTRNGRSVLRRNWIRYSQNRGLDLGKNPTVVDDCDIDDCGGIAVWNGVFQYLDLFTDNDAQNNAGGDFVYCTDANVVVGGTTQLGKRNTLNDSGVTVIGPEFFSSHDLVVQAGDRLILDPGMIVKWVRGRCFVRGTIDMIATEAEPIIFTSFEDDTAGGDTNKDGGATQPAPGDWGTFEVSDSSNPATGNLQYVSFRYLNSGSVAVRNAICTLNMDRCEVVDGSGAGVQAQNATLVMTNSEIRDCQGIAMLNLSWENVMACRDNRASGNGSDHIRVFTGLLTSSVTIDERNLLNRVIELEGGTTVGNGGSLILEGGVILKPRSGSLNVSPGGHVEFLGGGWRPVVWTSLRDDQFGGDTNLDGSATTPVPGNVSPINIAAGATGIFRNVFLRYGGFQGITCNSDQFRMESVRAQECLGDGIVVTALQGDLVQPVAWDNGDQGVDLRAGTANVIFGTSAGNVGGGFVSGASHTGQVRSSISWANGGGNFPGYVDTDVFQSVGDFAGVNANINANPQFDNLGNGVLSLAANSPALDNGDQALARTLRADHDESSRITRGVPGGALRADRGAYERSPFRLFPTGDNPSLGSNLEVTAFGPQGFYTVVLGVLDTTLFVPGFGYNLAGVQGAVVAPGLSPLSSSLFFGIPNDPNLLHLDFGVQAVGFTTLVNHPALSNMVRLRIVE